MFSSRKTEFGDKLCSGGKRKGSVLKGFPTPLGDPTAQDSEPEFLIF
jgi:hypothetical protein